MAFGLFKSKEQKAAEAKAAEQKKRIGEMSDHLDPKSDTVPYRNEKKARQAAQETARHIEGVRDEIDELLRTLSKEIALSIDDAEDDAQEIRDLAVRIRRMDLGQYAGVTDAILVFIRNQVRTAITNAHQKNVASIFGFTREIDGLLSELEDPQSAKLFTDERYLKRRLRVVELIAAKEKLEGERIRELKQRDKIKAAMESGRLTQRKALEEVNAVRVRVEDLERQIKNIGNDLLGAQTALKEVQAQVLNTLKDQAADVDTYNDIADQKADIEAITEERNAAINRLRADNSAVSSDDMNFHNDNKAEISQADIDNAFDF